MQNSFPDLTLFTSNEKAHAHFVGIKGVAQTSLACMLADRGLHITGSDVAEAFVTQPGLDRLGCEIQIGFEYAIPSETTVVIYTAAHGGPENPQVKAACAAGIPCISQAEAIGIISQQLPTIAVCGVGGKSTTSAMLVWMLTQLSIPIAYSVGVGSIPGLPATGAWPRNAKLLVVEADEYVTDPARARSGHTITPRFSYLAPWVIICTKLAYDHPDVYRDFQHTQQVFADFFAKLPDEGCLVFPASQAHILLEAPFATSAIPNIARQIVRTVSTHHPADQERHVRSAEVAPTHTATLCTAPGKNTLMLTALQTTEEITATLQIPGEHNVENAAYALCALEFVSKQKPELNLNLRAAATSLSAFRSTQRRFEYRGRMNATDFFDDYAHHPRELFAAIRAAAAWQPDANQVVIFQPHTYSRTKELFDEFVDSFSEAQTIIITEIFASAREIPDPSITAKILATRIREKFPQKKIVYAPTLDDVRSWLRHFLSVQPIKLSKSAPDHLVLTLGAGDIYHILDDSYDGIAIWYEHPLAPHTYAKIGGPAEIYLEVQTVSQLQAVVQQAESLELPLTILGGGSNVLIEDNGVRGVVVRYLDERIEVVACETNAGIAIRAGAGIKTASLVKFSVDSGATGLEPFLGVPGTLGGAIYNNAHYLEKLIGTYISRVLVLDPGEVEREPYWVEHAACGFAYEKSRFQTSGEIILAAEFSLQPGDTAESRELIANATRYRANTQPLGIPSSGCVFQNPPNTEELRRRFPQFADRATIPAGFLIDQAGLKNTRVGAVAVSNKHAAWIINEGGGTSVQVHELINTIKQTVLQKFGVSLHEEIFILGS